MIPSSPVLLRVDDVSKSFGGLRAVDGCSLEVQQGTITALIGPNGAGKSTLFNIICGLYAPDSGRIWLRSRRTPEAPRQDLGSAVNRAWHGVDRVARGVFRGATLGGMWDRLDRIARDYLTPPAVPPPWARLDGLPPHLIVRRGLAKTWQVPREFKNLPVLDNVMLAARGNPGEHLTNVIFRPLSAWRKERELEEAARKILGTVGLRSLAEEPAKNLSGGQKKLLELGRALMSDPQLILLDEPMAGVNPVLAGQLMDLVTRLRDAGHTFFLVEHDMETVMSRCDWIIVMHEGRKIAEGLPHEISANPLVLDSYLGG